jgi:3-hydroxyisobutyrate dehydrogenase-like beta-hydroxyacid dehydrogenase
MDATPAIAWIGLGKLGLPMAARLAAAGHQVVGQDRDPGRAALGAEGGLEIVPTLAEAAAGRDVIFSCLPDDAVLRAVALSPAGVLTAMEPGTVFVETSTVSPDVSAEVGREAAAAGIAYLRMPISGNASIAHTGALTCFASGPQEAFERVRPLAAAFTRAQTYLGEAEEARYAKLAVNLMIAVSAGMMAESLALARRGNIAWGDILDVLSGSAVASPMVKYKVGSLRERDFTSTFSCRQMAKDLDLILGAGRSIEVPMPLAALTRQLYASLIAQGAGDEDFIATVKHVERLAGLGEPETDIQGGDDAKFR